VKYHPDKNLGKAASLLEECALAFQRVREAFAELDTPDKLEAHRQRCAQEPRD